MRDPIMRALIVHAIKQKFGDLGMTNQEGNKEVIGLVCNRKKKKKTMMVHVWLGQKEIVLFGN